MKFAQTGSYEGVWQIGKTRISSYSSYAGTDGCLFYFPENDPDGSYMMRDKKVSV